MGIGYQIIGSGPMKVLVHHGWLANSCIWNWTIPFLNTNDFTYVFMDYRGYGLSKNLPREITIDEMARDGLELMNSLGYSEFHVLGHSMGGAAAQYTAGIAPEKVKSIVVFTPIGSDGFQTDEDTLRGLENSFNSDGVRGIMQMAIGHEIDDNLLDTMVQYSLATIGNEDVFKGYLNNWVNANYKEVTDNSNVPALAVVGGTDPLVPKEYVENNLGKEFVKGKVTVMDGVGHYPMVENPEGCARLWETVIRANE